MPEQVFVFIKEAAIGKVDRFKLCTLLGLDFTFHLVGNYQDNIPDYIIILIKQSEKH